MKGAEQFFAAVIAACAFAGVALGSRFFEGKEKRRKQIFVYYTYLSNTAIGLYHVLLLFPAVRRSVLNAPIVRFSAMLSILITFLLFFFIITRFGREPPEKRLKYFRHKLGNIFVHYAVPLLTLLEWILTADKQGLGIRAAFCWLVVPGLYFCFMTYYHSLKRGIESTGRYWPYEFVDMEKIGLKTWCIRVGGIFAGFFLLGLAAVALTALFTT